MKAIELLDELKEELESSPKAVFSNKRTVDLDIVLEILGDMRKALPVEMEEAGQIVREKEAILAAARDEAASIVKSADDELQTRISDESIAQEAEALSRQIKAQAEANAKEITIGAKEYADDILAELENYLADYLKLIRKNRLELAGKKKRE
jgi:vacuolar-type H+-ATPase subunit E/Vma4